MIHSLLLDCGTLEGSEPLVLLETVTEELGTLRSDVVFAEAANASRFEVSVGVNGP